MEKKEPLKRVVCAECEHEVDWNDGVCPVCDGSFEGEPLDREDFGI